VKKFIKGMSKDAERVDQPQGTYRDALNANINDLKGAITNEQGNVLKASNIQVVGQAALPQGKILVLGIDETISISGILLVDPIENTSTTLLARTDLNFSVQHPIETTVRKNAKGDTLVYFTDNVYEEVETEAYTYVSNNNPPRVFNVDRQLRALEQPGSTPLYIYEDSNFTADKLDILPNAGLIPRIDGIAIKEGGGLSTAAYHLALAYADEDLVETDYLVISNPVYIVKAAEDLVPMELMIGDQRGTQTKKSIVWKVRIYEDCNYKYIQPAIIRVEGGAEGIEVREVFKLEPIIHPKKDDIINIVHTGIENYSTGSLDEIVTPAAKYLSAKTLTQADNRLYMANLKTRPDIGYQKFANNITIRPVVEDIPSFEPFYVDGAILNSGYGTIYDTQHTPANLGEVYEYNSTLSGERGYKDANRLFRKKGYRRGEVYALYISFILNDGTESFAYHIPGRAPEKLYKYNGNLLTEFYEYTPISNIGWDLTSFNVSGANGPTPGEWLDSTARVCDLYDTSIWELETNHETGYWENEDEIYPDTEDFDIWDVDAYGNAVNTNTSLRNQKVRHHKLPSNHNYVYRYVTGNSSPNNWNNSDNSERVEFTEDVKILGVKLQNIKIPKDILSQVQGYKVYYAKRKEEDKTIIGSGIPTPSQPLYSVVVGLTSKDAAIFDKWSTAFAMEGEFARAVRPGTAMKITGELGWSGNSFAGTPVCGIHNFSLLRQEKPIINTTHLDMQFVATCRFFKGGPHLYRPDVSTEESDIGFDDMGWIHPDLGNTGGATGVDGNGTFPVVRAWKTALLVANVYDTNINGGDVQTTMTGSGAYSLTPWNPVIRITSAAYLPGLRNLKEVSTTFGVDYLINNIGDTRIALRAHTGIPLLTGFHPLGNDSDIWAKGEIDTFGPGTDVSNLPDWAQGVVEYLTGLFSSGDEEEEEEDEYIYVYDGLTWHGRKAGYLNLDPGIPHAQNFTLKDNSTGEGKPNIFIANICSRKSNVFSPFDRQFLVDTGHYQQLHSPDLNTGIVASDDIGYKIEEATANTSFNYYSGADSLDIFGGDTYICRYAVRATSMAMGYTYRKDPIFGPISIPYELYKYSGTEFGTMMGGVQILPPPVDVLGEYSYSSNYDWYLGEDSDAEGVVGSLFDLDYWSTQNYSPTCQLVYYMCESDDNINFRHAYDTERGIDSTAGKFFPHSTAASVIFESPLTDMTRRDNLLYESHYSAVQDIKTAQPFPKKSSVILNTYPTRIIRSSIDFNSIVDRYREFFILEKLDLVETTGGIWKITEVKNILYIQTEQSFFATKGQEELKLGANNVFIGSGNIFAKAPDKLMEADIATAGTKSQFAALRAPEGYFFLSVLEKKAYLLGKSLEPVSSHGMEDWFLENVPFKLEQYGLNPYADYTAINLDAPTQYFGFVSTYDPNYNRIILTKNELVPTSLFITMYTNGEIEIDSTTGEYSYSSSAPATYATLYGRPVYTNTNLFTPGGWTISYLPAFKVWVSRHSYIPKMYTATSKDFYSYSDNKVWEHSDFTNPGNFYGTVYNFEFEYIDNTKPGTPKTFTSIYYWGDVTENESHTIPNVKYTNTGFTSYYVYNTRQISGNNTDINYLNNIRLVDKIWYINEFRDMSLQQTSVDANLVTGVANVQDNFTTGVIVPSETATMFTEEGVVNTSYIDTNKQWYDQRRFVDHFLGVRLIASNVSKKLINLYAAGTKHKQSFR
jgi:hypothetical protein